MATAIGITLALFGAGARALSRERRGESKKWRRWGFWIFLLSNVLWLGWGWRDHAYALIVLQFGLAILNIRGVSKNERA